MNITGHRGHGTSRKRLWPRLILLSLCLAAPILGATPTDREQAERLLDLEQQLGVDNHPDLLRALQGPISTASRYVRLIARVTGTMTYQDPGGAGTVTRLFLDADGTSTHVDCGGALDVTKGAAVRLVYELPPAQSEDARPRPMVWCKNAVAEEVLAARQRAAIEAAQREAAAPEGLPAMAPAQVSPAADSGSTGPRGFASPAPQQQATAAAGGAGTQQAYGAAAYTPPVDLQQQFHAYVRFAKAMNSKLSDHEALRIAQSIFKYCDYYQVSRPLVASVIYAESMYNPIAKSPKGALGLCQLMPATAKAMGISYPYDIEWNIYGGVQYLRAQLDRYAAHPNNERFARAMSAYNAGAGAVEKYGGIPPYRETQNFVRKVAGKFNELWSAGYR